MSRTCLFFHAHPDDEALLTSGTMAMLAQKGHKVVIVFATSGEAGLSANDGNLGTIRQQEAIASATALGCSKIEFLGYADSGLASGEGKGPAGGKGFATCDRIEAAKQLAKILEREKAELLITYDRQGGYGHPDHVQVHHVGQLAAELAGTPRVLEATVDRTWLLRALRLARLVRRFDIRPFYQAYSSRSEITHRINVRPYLAFKRASLAAHATQTTGGSAPRTITVLLRLPKPLFSLVMGTEWYVEPSRPFRRA